jgi:pimeloyl-ACP methyl ester carboxylesterase
VSRLAGGTGVASSGPFLGRWEGREDGADDELERGRGSVSWRAMTRLLYGAADPMLGPDLIGGYETNPEDLAMEMIEGAAHFMVDDRPDAVADRILAFSARSEAPAGLPS